MTVLAPFKAQLVGGNINHITTVDTVVIYGSTGLDHWADPGDPWDRMQLGPANLPGVWEITSGECARQVDHKKTKNKDGAHIKDLGVLPSRFAARGRMYTRADWQEMQKIIPMINPKKAGGLRFPLTIFHPAISVLGVTTIYIERIRPPEVKDGILEFTFDMIEWTAEPKEAKTSTDVAAKNAAQSAAQRAANAAVGGGFFAGRVHGFSDPSQSAAQQFQRTGQGAGGEELPPSVSATAAINPAQPGASGGWDGSQ